MKKLLICLAVLFSFFFVSCKGKENTFDGMTKAEFDAASKDDEVKVTTYIQAKQSWWENEGVGVASFYTENKEAGYFLYNMPCTKEEYDKLTKGTCINVTGKKSSWAGEVEIIEATYEIYSGDTFVAESKDVTSIYDTEDLIKNQNQFVSIKDVVIEASHKDGSDEEFAFLYKYNGSGEKGTNCDLYFYGSINGNTYQFTVESYLMPEGSDVYSAVENLQIGAHVDLEGFLYWYEGPQPHITNVVVK